MKAIVAVVFLSVCCKAYEEYKDIEYDRKDNDDFDDQYYSENMEDITTTTIVTMTTTDETGEIHYRMRRFGEKSSGARTLSLEEIEDVKGALKELLAGRQLDGLTTGTETITSTDKPMIETTHDLTGLTKEVDSVDRTKFYEELIEEIINDAKKQGQGTNTARYTKPNLFETQTDGAFEKINDSKTTHTIDGEEETQTSSKIYNIGNLRHNTNASIITFTTQRAPTKTPPMESMWTFPTQRAPTKTPLMESMWTFPTQRAPTKTPPIESMWTITTQRAPTKTPPMESIWTFPTHRAPTKTPPIESMWIFTTQRAPTKTQRAPTKTPPMKSMWKGGKEVSTPPKASNSKLFPSQNESHFPHWAQNLPLALLPEAPKRTLSRTSARITIETVYDKKFGKLSKNAPSGFGNEEKGEKFRWFDNIDDDYIEPDQSKERSSKLAHNFPNMFPADRPFIPRRKAKKKLGRQGITTPGRTTRRKASTNTEGEAGPGDSDGEGDFHDPQKFISTSKSTTTVSRRTTLISADVHKYPYPYPHEMFPNTTSTNATTFFRTKRRKTTTKLHSKPHVDAPALLSIIQRLTKDFESNITEMFNETLQTYDVPTCPPKGYRGPVFFNLQNATTVAKCFVCGMKEGAIPTESFCGDAFATDFLPLVPIDPQARQHLVRFRKYCRYLEVNNYYENETEPRSVFGRFTGGCSVRFMDLSNVYTQRACRNKRRAMTGKHFASKRMAKLEMALKEVDNGCITSPMASLVPMSRGISLYARFHACVCTGSFCNTAELHQPWISYIAVLVCWTVMSFERWVLGHRFWFRTM